MHITQRLHAILLRRKSDGRLMFPHAVRAHYDEIMQYMPSALTEDEKANYRKR